MKNPDTTPKFSRDQRGIVSIIVTMVLMVVLTLIVLSFAKISQRAERDAADRQLSTQAFYAAESGINIAHKKLVDDAALRGTYTTDCSTFTSVASLGALPVSVGAASGNAFVTCLFVDAEPTSLEYTKTDAQVVFPYNPVGVGASSTMRIDWDDGDPTTSYPAGCVGLSPGSNPALSSCATPVLRIEITNLSTTQVLFAYPSGTNSAPTFSASTGLRPTGRCITGASPKECFITIQGVPTGSYVRVKGIYGSIALSIKENSGKKLKDAQAIIDATGRAADLERRIQVRIPISGLPKDPPPYGLEGADKICKQFSLHGPANPPTDDGTCSSGGFPD